MHRFLFLCAKPLLEKTFLYMTPSSAFSKFHVGVFLGFFDSCCQALVLSWDVSLLHGSVVFPSLALHRGLHVEKLSAALRMYWHLSVPEERVAASTLGAVRCQQPRGKCSP